MDKFMQQMREAFANEALWKEFQTGIWDTIYSTVAATLVACVLYDREYGCLPLDSDCYMLGKCWTGSYCRYFRESVLPLDPALEASLMSEGPRPDFKICPVCGGPVPPDRRQAYCSAACAKKAHRRQQREYMRKKRGASVDN